MFKLPAIKNTHSKFPLKLSSHCGFVYLVSLRDTVAKCGGGECFHTILLPNCINNLNHIIK